MPRANKAKKKKGGSSTPGSSKGSNCHRSQLKNLMSKDSKLPKKNPELYIKCCNACDKEKGNRPGNHTHIVITE